MKKLIFLFHCLVLVLPVFSQQKDFLITAFGAKPDGKTINTIAIQTAIDKAAAMGGGKVIVGAGSFVTGVIYLKTGVELHLQKDAVLLGSTNRLDYGKGDAEALITAIGQHHISITGKGEINGRGRKLVEDLYRLLKAGVLQDDQWKIKRPTEKNRPRLIYFSECRDVKVTGITVKNGSGWIQDYVRCNNVVIDSITVISKEYWNNDGIDIVNSKNVSITNCYVDAADDAICLKSEGKVLDSCENIYVANCKLRSSASAFKIGTGSKGGFRNIKVRNLEVFDTYRSAIALEAVDGGFLENVDIQNIKATNTGNAVFIRLGHRNNNSLYSTIKNIRIADVYAEIPEGKPDKGYALEGPGLKYPPGIRPAVPGTIQSVSPWNRPDGDSTAIEYLHNIFPSSITGLPGHPVQNIILENIEIVYAGGAKKDRAFFPADSLTKITEATSSYPEFSMFGELPCWGLYLRHAEGITLRNLTMRYKKDDFRAALIADDVKGLKMEGVNIPSFNQLPVIILHNTPGPGLNKINLPVDISRGITIKNE
ncbi:MAG: glycoside hydrolase family 28 [Ferruginibacter sp.]|nr:glycoside hydrolase family 28 [Ferruginibacter sp.]